MNEQYSVINQIRKMLGVKFFTPLPWMKDNVLYWEPQEKYFIDKKIRYKWPIK
jgi:hypothetical protein